MSSNETDTTTRMNVWQSAATLVYDDGSLRWTEFVREPKRKKKHIDKVLKKMGR